MVNVGLVRQQHQFKGYSNQEEEGSQDQSVRVVKWNLVSTDGQDNNQELKKTKLVVNN